MNVTAMFLEILIAGFETAVWLVMLYLIVTGRQRICLPTDASWLTLALPAGFALLYALGVLVDRIADNIYTKVDELIRAETAFSRREMAVYDINVHRARLRLYAANPGASTFLDYVRSRIRIARSTALNLYFILSAFIILCAARPWVITELGGCSCCVAVIFLLAALLCSAEFTWRRVSRTYYWRLVEAYKESRRSEKDSQDTGERGWPPASRSCAARSGGGHLTRRRSKHFGAR